MERLTEKHYTGKGYYLLCSGKLRCPNKCEDCEKLDEAIDRLAAYEDTGLEPEQAAALKAYTERKAVMMVTEIDGMPIDRVRELIEAEQEGRLVVLPVKPGTKVYTTRWWDDVPETCTDSRGKKFQRMTQRHKVTEEEFLPFSLDYIQFGEKVFLTREEAEKALRGGTHE